VLSRSSVAQSPALPLPRPLPYPRLTLPDTMQQYYRARAAEYDLFYQAPERLSELTLLQAWLIERTRGLNILEVAAGDRLLDRNSSTVCSGHYRDRFECRDP
jgi:hypothetical protein